jgi:hypothetical protein
MWNDLRTKESVDATQFKNKKEALAYVSGKNAQYGKYFSKVPHLLNILKSSYKEFFNADKSFYKGETEYLRRNTLNIASKKLYVTETSDKYNISSSRGKLLKEIKKVEVNEND